ncbi:MAG TPA: metallopeptidase family protein [Myxococcales bacterium]|nr:metallopeptidase family protein [Myxococcales bacterium]
MPRASPPEPVEPLLDLAASAYEAGKWAEVLELARRALRVDARHPEALHFEATALAEAGDLDASLQAFRRALAAAPDDVELMLGAADLLVSRFGEDRAAVEEGLDLCRRGRAQAARRGDQELQYQLCLLEAMGFNQLGECEQALELSDQALALEPGSLDALRERAIALFERCRFSEAEKDLRKLAQRAPDDAWAQHYLGLSAERRGDAREAKKRFDRARRLDPGEFPAPVTLTEEEFDRAVADALEQLPSHVKPYLGNTTISVELLPGEEDLTSSDPPLSPCILGVFRGTPIGERSVTSSADHFPASIVLYQKNLERFARTRAELCEQIGITLLHEVGHLVGLDEEDLWERGLE